MMLQQSWLSISVPDTTNKSGLIEELTISSTEESLEKLVKKYPQSRIAIEVAGSSQMARTKRKSAEIE